MQPGFVDFPNFAQGLASREAISEAREFLKPTRWNFIRAATQEWKDKWSRSLSFEEASVDIKSERKEGKASV